MISLEQELQSRFVCRKCKGQSASVDRVNTTGSGLSRFLNIQRHRFFAVSCDRCGYTEFYNRRTLEGSNDWLDVLDLFTS